MHCNIKGKSSRGRQPKTWIENIEEDLKATNMDMRTAAEVIRDREKWRRIVVSMQYISATTVTRLITTGNSRSNRAARPVSTAREDAGTVYRALSTTLTLTDYRETYFPVFA